MCTRGLNLVFTNFVHVYHCNLKNILRKICMYILRMYEKAVAWSRELQ